MSEPDLTFATLDPGTDERFVSLRRQLSVSAFGVNLLAVICLGSIPLRGSAKAEISDPKYCHVLK